MKQVTKLLVRRWFLYRLALMLMISMGACGPAPTSTPTLEPTPVPSNTPEPTPIPAPPDAPTLDHPSVVTLDAGQQIPVSANSEGAITYSWSLQGDGIISIDTGPAVIYTAPDGIGGVAILSVTAYNETGLASPITTMTINVNPGKVKIKELEIVVPEDGSNLVRNQQTDCIGIYELSYGTDTTGIYVWILAGDEFGNYYIQNPPVSLKTDGTWETSIQPGRGITKLFAVQVTEEGNDLFKRKVLRDDFAGFTDLPEGSIIHYSINIQT